jgi:hypothetical protein
VAFGIEDQKLGAGVFNSIVEKMRRRLQPRRGKNITWGEGAETHQYVFKLEI